MRQDRAALLRKLPMLTEADAPEKRLTALLNAALSDGVKAFGPNVHRGMIFRPTADNEWLEPIADYRMPALTLRDSRYYLGKDKQFQAHTGVARTVHLTGALKVVCITEKDGRWFSEDPDYRPPSSSETAPAYRTFICVAIEWQGERFGVLCLDSHEAACFNTEEARQLISKLGTRLATPFVMHQRIQEMQTMRVQRIGAPAPRPGRVQIK